MLKQTRFIVAFGLAVSLAISAKAQDAQTVVATVNGEEITLGHMIVARATLPQQYQNLPDEVLFDGILSQMIDQTLLAQDYSDDLPARAILSLENEERSLRAGENLDTMLASVLNEETIKAQYDSQYADAQPTQEFDASHILVETEEEALEIKKQLDEGAVFAVLAQEKSTGPSGPNGGALGWFGKGAMVPEFEDAVVALTVGEVSMPVQTQFGWHVIKLNEERSADVPTLDEVRIEIENSVREAAIQGKIQMLRDTAEINKEVAADITPEMLSKLEWVQ